MSSSQFNLLMSTWNQCFATVASFELQMSRGRECFVDIVNTVDCLFGLCSACRWILPSPFGRASLRGLWGTQRAATSGITLRSGGGTHPSGRMTTPWCWLELLFITSEGFTRLTCWDFYILLVFVSDCCISRNLSQVLLTTLTEIRLHPPLSFVDVTNMCLWNQ